MYGGLVFRGTQRIEPPSDAHIFVLLLCACCIGWLPLIPLFVCYSARRDAMTFFATNNTSAGNEASQRSRQWLLFTYITFILEVICIIVLVVLLANDVIFLRRTAYTDTRVYVD
eukprot:GEMP01027028.1.p1 GENE.GEMP01027028.1~~GEMP01027028.1.p1  ORF type:complete len:114 (+),score=10.14 GEMP01027028.1:122-463(+)